MVDAKGRKGLATLEQGEVFGSQYWGRFEFSPKLTMDGGRKATAMWTNLRGEDTPTPGTVQLFAKKGGCTTAEACQASFVQSFGGDTPGTDLVATSHKVAIAFPAGTQDFQVLLTGAIFFRPDGLVDAHFYQVDAAAADVR